MTIKNCITPVSEHSVGALKVFVKLDQSLTSVSDTSTGSAFTTDEVLLTVSYMFVQINLCS